MRINYPDTLDGFSLEISRADRNAQPSTIFPSSEDVFYILQELEKKMGSTGSTDTGSLDYRVTALESVTPVTASSGSSSPLTTKGDIWIYSTTDDRLDSSAATDGWVLVKDSTQAKGLKWAAGAGGSGITTLNTLTAVTQTFAKVDDTNMSLTIGSVTSTHTFTLAWVGTLADGRIASAATWNAKEVVLTFSTGLTRTVNTITVNTSQNITTLSNLTTNGFVKTGGGTGALSVDTATYLTGNQTITLTSEVTGSGATSITTTINKSITPSWLGLHSFTAGVSSIYSPTGAGTAALIVQNNSGSSVGSVVLFTGQAVTHLDIRSNGTTYFNSSLSGFAKLTSGLLSAGSILASDITSAQNLSVGSSISITAGTGTGATLQAVTIDTIQDIRTSATPQFARLGIGAAADSAAILMFSSAQSSTTSQFLLRNSGANPGIISMLNFVGDNVSIGFDVEWLPAGWTARHAAVSWIYKTASRLMIYGSTGNSIGGLATTNTYLTTELSTGFVGIAKVGAGGSTPLSRLEVDGLVQSNRVSFVSETIDVNYCTSVVGYYYVQAAHTLTVLAGGTMEII